MNNKVSFNPDQLKAIVNYIINSYKNDYENGNVSEPHFEHVDSNGHRFKIGYIPNNEGGKVSMDIKIVYKGKI